MQKNKHEHQEYKQWWYVVLLLTEQEKLAAVDKAVPTTLPLSFIPSKNELIIIALTPIMHNRQTPLVARETDGHTHDDEDSSLLICWLT